MFVKNKGGEVFEMSDTDASNALSSGWSQASDSDLKEIENESKYGNAVGSGLIQGFGRGATLGGIDVAAAEGLIPGTDQESRREIRERNPISSFIGEIAGNAALAYGTGASSLIPNIAGKTVLGKALATGVKGAIASIGPGVQNAITQQALYAEDPHEAAENILSTHGALNIAKGAATFAGFGGLFGSAGSLVASGAGKLANIASSKLESLSNRLAADAAGPYTRQSDFAARAGGLENIGKVLREEGIQGKTVFSKPLSAKNLRELAKVEGDKWSGKIGDIIDKHADAQVSKSEIMSQITDDIFNPLSEFESASGKRTVRQVMGEIKTLIPDETLEGGTIDLRTLKNLNTKLAKKAKYASKTNEETALAIRKVRDIIEDKITNTLDPIVQGTELEGAYLKAKDRMSVFRWVEETAANRVKHQEGSNVFGLPEYLVGGATAIMTGGPVNPASLAKAGAAAYATKVARQRGSSFMSGLLSTPGNISKFASANQKVASAIEKASSAIALGEKVTPIAIARSVTDKEVKDFYKLVADYQTNPEKVAQSVSQSMQGLSQVDQNVADAAKAKLTQSIAYAAGKMPKNPTQTPEGLLAGYDWKPSDAEMASFSRTLRAIDDPLTVMNDIAKGLGDPEGIEALRELYPSIYARLTSAVMDKLSTQRGYVPYRKRLLLTRLFRTPMDYSMNAQMMARLQVPIQPQNDMMQPQNGAIKPMNLADAQPSNIGRAEAR